MRGKRLTFTLGLAILLAIGQLGCTVKTAKGNKPPKNRFLLQVLTDKTSSGSDSILPAESTEIRQGIDELDPLSVSVVRFGEGSLSIWDTPDVPFELPTPIPAEEFNEEAAEKELSESCRARKPCRDSKIRDMHKAHDVVVQGQDSQYQKARNAKLDLITETIVRAPSQSAACTDLYGTRDRIATDAFQRVILITDGQHTCSNQSSTKTFPQSTKVLVLLNAIKSELAGDAFDKRKIFVENLFPRGNVTVIPIVSATSEKIKEALR